MYITYLVVSTYTSKQEGWVWRDGVGLGRDWGGVAKTRKEQQRHCAKENILNREKNKGKNSAQKGDNCKGYQLGLLARVLPP
jgi:hypothetical protein